MTPDMSLLSVTSKKAHHRQWQDVWAESENTTCALWWNKMDNTFQVHTWGRNDYTSRFKVRGLDE